MKRTKNLKITPSTHELLKKYCDEHGLKMFAFVEKIIKEKYKSLIDRLDPTTNEKYRELANSLEQ